ncbi:cation channel sperm-associated auxiliary subunit gamma isoform X2 [Hemicordylus capensis]|nr:cation channel sperm-associated auxiliary subunit gamma isoform X2 [Hemicordylus capensis]
MRTPGRGGRPPHARASPPVTRQPLSPGEGSAGACVERDNRSSEAGSGGASGGVRDAKLRFLCEYHQAAAAAMWHLYSAPRLLFLVLLQTKHYSSSDCKWTASVNMFGALGAGRHIFLNQSVVKSVTTVFEELVDSAIDPEDKNAHYLGFPYYLKINLSCRLQDSESAIRLAHYTGLRPIVIVAFEEPVHPVVQKQEQLEIEMRAAPFRVPGQCDSEEVCNMCWYVPMPLLSGSAVMHVKIKSNDLGLPVDSKRMSINVNGFAYMSNKRAFFRIGRKVLKLREFLALDHKSRPLWNTYKHAPVLILGGIPNSKIVLLSDTGYEDFFSIELGIDSCWIGSLSCPQATFSSSIVDTISTESTLFIRQNQLVYYFTGSYPILQLNTSGSELWARILNNVCVKNLNPVHFAQNNTEYVIALGGGWQEGEFFLITSKDGIVHVSKSKRSDGKTACNFLRLTKCSIVWAVFSTQENKFILLVNELETNNHFIVFFYREGEYFEHVYEPPKFVPKGSDKGFVMLLGNEQYTNTSLVPRGLSFNPFSMIFYIWGNVILQSNDMVSYIYLSNFPSTSFIKYFVQSYHGQFACVTDEDEIWVADERGSEIKKVYPSKAWDVFSTLQVMGGSPDYGLQEALVSVFYDMDELQELVYMANGSSKERIIKRKFPLDYILTYDQMITIAYKSILYEGRDYIRFTHPCPFAILRIVELPLPQRFTRVEHYRAEPPDIMDKTGFHDNRTLAVYQGLVFQLLWLHSAYNRPYADPVHDPTWRWWKDKKENAEYYYYVASNRNSSGGMYVDMSNYAKIYTRTSNNKLPVTIFLDKNNTYTFSVYLSIRTSKESMGESAEENSLNAVWLTVVLAHPEYLHAHLQRQELISRGSVLYEVTISDAGLYPRQELSGKNLLKSSLVMKVVRSRMNCYHYTDEGPEITGNNHMGVNVGCPPGKRLAFDITGTLKETKLKNKRYFDCYYPDPEMPCFYFSDVLYPSFLIQDMVTGDSGLFKGSYVFKVIGGGTLQENISFFTEEEVVQYNTMNGSDTSSLIWLRHESVEDMVDPEGFHILSYNNSGIVWVCQKNSPCYDTVPTEMSAPDYFFVVKVSNRDVDQTTYCDYALQFIIHVHGLVLSPSRAMFLMQISMGVVIILVIIYILIYILSPRVKIFCHKTFRRFGDAFAFRTAATSISVTRYFRTGNGSVWLGFYLPAAASHLSRQIATLPTLGTQRERERESSAFSKLFQG